MVSQTNEQALESAIEKRLTGTCLEDLKASGTTVQEAQTQYGLSNGYYIGDTNDFNPKYAVDETRFWHFLEATQKKS